MADSSVRSTPRAIDLDRMSGPDIRSAFLIENVFANQPGVLTFTDLDRMAVGGVAPQGKSVTLQDDRETGTSFFLERREMGILNVGQGNGVVVCDGKRFPLDRLDCLYVGMGTKSVSFEGDTKFYVVSCPAHQAFPTKSVKHKDIKPIELGGQPTANARRLHQYIHANGIKSCQLVMGFTELLEGSVWNTMPPHTHSRRSEIYFYFDLGENLVVHLLGEPTNTRHLIVRDGDVALSPPWSIHCGCGTSAYRFVWAMAGENQTFDDMDKFPMGTLK